MKLIKHKLFFAWQYDKEEQWLNGMSENGWQLVRVGFCRYEFKKAEPGEYIYRLQMLEHLPQSAAGQKYIAFVEDTGAETVGTLFRWVYFRKKASDGPFELFSDAATRIGHMRDMLAVSGILGVANLVNGFNSVTGGSAVIAVVCLTVGAVCVLGCIILWLKRRALIKQRDLYE